MKRVVSILMAALMLVSLCTVTSTARGYTLSVPESVSAHNLEAYGLHTLNVYSTNKAPEIDGVIDTGEYPGPLNGMSLQSVPGDNLWMNRYYPNSDGTQNSFYPECNWTEYVAREDMPDYIETYLTYDDSFFYFGVKTKIPAIRATTDNITGAKRNSTWFVEARTNFMQSDNLALSGGGNSSSFAQNRYYMYKGYDLGEDGQPLAQTATSVNLGKRVFTLYENGKFVTTTLSTYVDELGQSWNTTVYKRADNFTYKVTLYEEENKWGVTFEGRLPLGDVLRITDVEYEDGSPLDYVPEWGAWGFAVRLQAYVAKTGTFPNGTEYEIRPEDVLFAHTWLPTGGSGNSGANGVVAGYQLNNTVGAAIKNVHGKGSVGASFLMNPVHFLGEYDETFAYGEQYSVPTQSVLKETSRVTRTRGVLTSGVRGKNNRVVGVATQAAVATGDDLTLTVVLSATMLLCATAAVAVVIMKKRSARSH